MTRIFFVLVSVVLLWTLCLPMLYAQEAGGWDAHDLSVGIAQVGIIILIVVIAWIYFQKKKK